MRNPDETESKNNERIDYLLSELRFLENKISNLKKMRILSDLLSVATNELRTPLQKLSQDMLTIMKETRYREFDQQNGCYLSVIQKNALRLHCLYAHWVFANY